MLVLASMIPTRYDKASTWRLHRPRPAVIFSRQLFWCARYTKRAEKERRSTAGRSTRQVIVSRSCGGPTPRKAVYFHNGKSLV